MLNEQQVNEIYDSLSPYFFNKKENVVWMAANSLEVYALLDTSYRLVAMAKNPMTIKALSNIEYGGLYTFFTSEKAIHPQDYDFYVSYNRCWEFVKDLSCVTWQRNTNIKSKEKLYDYILMTQKAALLDKIHSELEYHRRPFVRLLSGQEIIYEQKNIEATEILKDNITEDETLKYPYTTGYAKVMNISLQEAAKQIKLQHEIKHTYLAENESLRIKYTEMIVNEKDIKNLHNIYDAFNISRQAYSSL
jgi:hypothetical protein